jgi:glycosyltransferase involved in cell wall biosynthesis
MMRPLAMPLISVIVPTMNEEKHLPIAFQSLKGQAEHEIIVVDKSSKDRTIEIAKAEGATVMDYQGRLLGARKVATDVAKGEYVFFLDADQVLKPGILQKCLEMIKDYDMLIIGESSYKPKGFTQRSISNQRKAIEKAGINGDYMHMYPRFFRREVLQKAYAMIPEEMVPKISALDDSYLFDKLTKVTKRIGFVPDAVMHHEEENMIELMRHWYRIGKSSRQFKDAEVEQFFHNDSFTKKTMKAVRGHYFVMAGFKELAYQCGRRL